MATVTIQCDQRSDGWDYGTCIACGHFSCTVTPKGHQWRCKLNSKAAAEKRAFRMLVAVELLNARGMTIQPDEVTIDYVGKIKKSQ